MYEIIDLLKYIIKKIIVYNKIDLYYNKMYILMQFVFVFIFKYLFIIFMIIFIYNKKSISNTTKKVWDATGFEIVIHDLNINYSS